MGEHPVDDRGEAADPVAVFQQRLQQLRSECGKPSFRDLARLFKLLGYPHAHTTIQAKVTGTTVPDWRFVETFVLACHRCAGNGGEPDLQPWQNAHLQMLASEAAPLVGDPYRRLDAFGEHDMVWFHGRREAVDQVVAAVREPRSAVLLLGPSGSGKSSLVHAGVLPAIRDGSLPGSDQWIQVSVRPRQNLFAELGQAGLLAANGSMPEAIDTRLADRPAECRLVLVIDQFEELLTPTAQEPEAEQVRLQALAQVSAVAGSPRVMLILVMRDDFYPLLSAQARELRTRLVLIDLPATLSKAQVDDIVRGPAKTAGLTWDTQLAERIVTEVLADYNLRPPRIGAEPNAGTETDAGIDGAVAAGQVPVTVLPLLELTLYQMWTRRAGTRLTHDGYRKTGGIRGAVASWCSAAVDLLPDGEKDCARQILTALVRPADPDRGVPAVRQQIPVDTLRQLITPSPADPAGSVPVDRVLEILTRQRIVTTSTLHIAVTPGGPLDGQVRIPVAELAHDALIRDWPQLQVWVGADHRFQDWLRRTGERHRRWQQHRTDDDLLQGSELAEGLDWDSRRRLPDDLAVFLHASRDQQQARTRRTRRINRILAGLLTVVLAAAGVAVWQWRTAVTAGQVALSRQLAAQSAALLPTKPDIADLLAVKAYRTSPTTEAVDSLHNAVAQPIPRTLTGHTGRVFAVAYSPDGAHLASGDADNTVRVWDLTTGSSRTLTGHTGTVWAVAYSPDGTHLASASTDKTVRVWDLATGSARTLHGHTDRLKAVAYSPDGTHLASAGYDGTVRVWDLATGSSRTLNGHAGIVFAVAYSPDGTHLASVSASGDDQMVRVWDLTTGSARTLHGHTSYVYAVAYSPDGTHLAAGGNYGTVWVWDLATGSARTLHGHTSYVYAVAYSPDGTYLASTGDDGTVRVWDLATGSSRTLTGHTGVVYVVAYSPDGKHLASSGYDETVRVWDLTTGSARTLTGHTDRVWAVAYSPDGKHLASASSDKTVRLWDLTTGSSRTLTGHTGIVYVVAYSPDGKHLASASSDKTVRVWDLTTGSSRTLTGHTNRVWAVAYSPDGKHLASAGDDGTVRVWDLATGISRTLTGHVKAVVYSPDGKHLASGDVDGTVRVWDLATGSSRTLTGHTGTVWAVAYSPDGKHLASAGSDKTVRVWDLTTGSARTLTGHTGVVYVVAYSPDGKHLASAGEDGTVRVWDLATGSSRTLTGHAGIVWAVAYSPDGKHLASAGDDETVRVWDGAGMAPSEMISLICDRLQRDLTPNERARYLPTADATLPVCPATR